MSGEEKPAHDTFTGGALAEMTLAQKLCELREDRLRLLGLENGFWKNVQLIGVGYALERQVQKWRLHRKGELAAVIADLRRQIDDDIDAIRGDADAWKKDDYRDSRLIEEVERVLERFGHESDEHALADMRRYVKIHQQELAAQIRKLGLDQAHPEPGAARSWGLFKNFLAARRLSTIVVAAAVVLGATGWTVTYVVVQRMNRNRPVEVVGDAVKTSHLGVLAARDVNDAAMTGNRLVNVYLEGSDDKTLLALQEALAARVGEAAQSIPAARADYARSKPLLDELGPRSRRLFAAWTHTENENGHWEERCTTTTDDDGNEDESCSSEYVCDYVDHTWTFDPAIAEASVGPFAESAAKARTVAPALSDLLRLRAEARARVEGGAAFAALEPAERQAAIDRAQDWLRSLTVAQSDEVAFEMRDIDDACEPGGEVEWLRSQLGSFPRFSSDRDHGCGAGAAPAEYDRCAALDARVQRVVEAHRTILEKLDVAATSATALATSLGEIDRRIRGGADPDDLSAQYGELGEHTIALHHSLNPESSFVMLTKGWRIALPLLALFVLATLGALGTFFGVRAWRRSAYYHRMYQRGIY
jgi:ribosomal 50S subunit-associated protein YjgA (DUF615 family)